jgi:hypothetical protein
MRYRVHERLPAAVNVPLTAVDPMDAGSSEALRARLACPTCGSIRFQEGRREERTIVYRCLHCWCLFHSAVRAD